MEELLKLIEGNPELGHEVEVMWARGASAQEVTGMLAGKGVGAEPAQVEELLAAMQARRAASIGKDEKVDRDQLKTVAGGWCAFWQSQQGTSDTCSSNFKDSRYDTMTRCLADNYCDEWWFSVQNCGQVGMKC